MRNIATPICAAAFAVALTACTSAVAQPTFDWEDKLQEVLDAARSRHVDAPTRKKLFRGAIRGALNALDPYSTFLTAKDLEQLRRRLRGRYSGIGVEIGIRLGRLTVIAPIDGGPADQAGIHAGDLILTIDGKSTVGMTVRDSAALLLGTAGTKVTVRVRSPEVARSTRTVELTRANIVVKAVKGGLLEDKGDPKRKIPPLRIAHLELRAFHRSSARELVERLQTLKPLSGVILDLRNNPGGLLRSAIDVVSIFVAKGIVVTTVGQKKRKLRTHRIRPLAANKRWLTSPRLPLVVLINKGSASASEIVAGALQDHGRAILVGRRSYGKGSVQSVIPLKHGSALKLTTARYRLPGGRIIDGRGLPPDLRARNPHKRRKRTVNKNAKPPPPDPVVELARDVIRSWSTLRNLRRPRG